MWPGLELQPHPTGSLSTTVGSTWEQRRRPSDLMVPSSVATGVSLWGWGRVREITCRVRSTPCPDGSLQTRAAQQPVLTKPGRIRITWTWAVPTAPRTPKNNLIPILETSWDLGAFAVVPAPGQMSPQATKYRETTKDLK